IIKKSGSWFSYNEMKIGQGTDRVKEFLIENQDILNEIETKVKTVLGLVKPSKDEGQDKE
ncbi:MAG: DNA recombination/repair protein RecA, partial [Candidatus Cloacimonetes bacterium]|nr:DNA recombination/repair protein RecA [Candidatus Cloacimonadota bacterium]